MPYLGSLEKNLARKRHFISLARNWTRGINVVDYGWVQRKVGRRGHENNFVIMTIFWDTYFSTPCVPLLESLATFL